MVRQEDNFETFKLHESFLLDATMPHDAASVPCDSDFCLLCEVATVFTDRSALMHERVQDRVRTVLQRADKKTEQRESKRAVAAVR